MLALMFNEFSSFAERSNGTGPWFMHDRKDLALGTKVGFYLDDRQLHSALK